MRKGIILGGENGSSEETGSRWVASDWTCLHHLLE